MKKLKQILAILLVVLLVSLYFITLILAITDKTKSMQMFEASILATIIIPILIWAYTFIYRLIRKNDEEDKNAK